MRSPETKSSPSLSAKSVPLEKSLTNKEMEIPTNTIVIFLKNSIIAIFAIK